MSTSSIALLLADGRFPGGGHAQSGGIEQAVTAEWVTDVDSLQEFLEGRLLTGGVVAAHLAAAVCAYLGGQDDLDGLRPWWPQVDAAASARLTSTAARHTSRRVGGQLLRSGLEVVPGPALSSLRSAHPHTDPHAAVTMGAIGATGGLSPQRTAEVAAYTTVAGPASAAVRLLGLDPLGVARVFAGLSGLIDQIAREAAVGSHRPLAELPAISAPASDWLAAEHADRKERLFAS